MSKSGTVMAKGCATDPCFSEFLVREYCGEIQYYRAQLGQWCTIPSEWVQKIVWNNSTKSEN